jgi:hypothetical protein
VCKCVHRRRNETHRENSRIICVRDLLNSMPLAFILAHAFAEEKSWLATSWPDIELELFAGIFLRLLKIIPLTAPNRLQGSRSGRALIEVDLSSTKEQTRARTSDLFFVGSTLRSSNNFNKQPGRSPTTRTNALPVPSLPATHETKKSNFHQNDFMFAKLNSRSQFREFFFLLFSFRENALSSM